MARVRAEGVGVHFFFDRQHRVLSPTLARLRRRVTEAWGLRDVDLEAGAGEAVALLGPSGAGKTTLLRAIAGVLVPDRGRVVVEGRVASLLSVEGGLMPTLTGRESALLLCVLAGLSRREARTSLDAVGELAGLGAEFDRPVASYSQGMRARLGFAAAVQARPTVLLLDEVHEALDHEFRAVVEEMSGELLRRGGVVVAAGHDHPLLEGLCNRALLLERGRVAADGPFGAVRDAYVGEA
jgi:ABC-type polysaccharide/polyol phosphate transport system ATPase subunit